MKRNNVRTVQVKMRDGTTTEHSYSSRKELDRIIALQESEMEVSATELAKAVRLNTQAVHALCESGEDW